MQGEVPPTTHPLVGGLLARWSPRARSVRRLARLRVAVCERGSILPPAEGALRGARVRVCGLASLGRSCKDREIPARGGSSAAWRRCCCGRNWPPRRRADTQPGTAFSPPCSQAAAAGRARGAARVRMALPKAPTRVARAHTCARERARRIAARNELGAPLVGAPRSAVSSARGPRARQLPAHELGWRRSVGARPPRPRAARASASRRAPPGPAAHTCATTSASSPRAGRSLCPRCVQHAARALFPSSCAARLLAVAAL